MPATRFSIEIQPVLPERLQRLSELAGDLYYSWDRSVRGLFRRLDPACWDGCAHNPKLFLRRVSQQVLEDAARDPMFLAEYRRALSAYDTYLEERPDDAYAEHLDPRGDLIAYFSAEFGFHQSMPIYAGGLGILAADYCKAMSHLRVPFVGVGLLYHQGYFTQRLLCDGEQQAEYPYREPADLPVTPAPGPDGEPLTVAVAVGPRTVHLKVWECRAGHIRLYLLDSDLPENHPDDRPITYQLYGGDHHTRIRQEVVLGIGGVRALRGLGLAPTVWHVNEGHAAFLVLERCRELTAAGQDFDSALEQAAASTVFTTHTPVPAGHDIFPAGLLHEHVAPYLGELGIEAERFFALGATPRSPDAFNMTALALRGSRFHNGVSRIHGDVGAEMEAYVWPQIPPPENPLGYVTNGVDVSTFLGLAWGALFDMYLDTGWRARIADEGFWDRFIDSIPDHAYQSTHQILKAELLEDCRRRVRVQFRRQGCSTAMRNRLLEALAPERLDTLVIGFARRFATYKRATLLFRDLERLARILNQTGRPVLVLFAGKAHPHDEPGRQLIRDIYHISMRPEFLGKVLMLEDYNFSMARTLMAGVDVWLNVPEYPKEACGTSGMKAAINGAVNLSVLDGWWGEAYDGENGWAITPHVGLDPDTRNRQEATELLDLLEHQIIPLFFERDAEGEPRGWIRKSKRSMKTTIPRFNSQRMARDYIRHYYAPASTQARRLAAEGGQGARELARWKRRIRETWPGVRAELAGQPPAAISTTESLPLKVAVELNGLDPEEVVVECLIGQEDAFGELDVEFTLTLTPTSERSRGACVYFTDLCASSHAEQLGGLKHYRLRVYPRHPLLTHRFEHGCMIWL